MEMVQKSRQRRKVESWIYKASLYNEEFFAVNDDIVEDINEGKFIEEDDPRHAESAEIHGKMRELENRVYRYFGFKKGRKWYCDSPEGVEILFLHFASQPEKLYDMFSIRAEATFGRPAETLSAWVVRAREEGLKMTDAPTVLFSIPEGWGSYIKFLWDLYTGDAISTETLVRELEHVHEIRRRFKYAPEFRDSRLPKALVKKLGLIEFYVSTLLTEDEHWEKIKREQKELLRKHGVVVATDEAG
jgi:hypothetical protein